jgi:cytoskeletal protein RodZ
LLVSVTSDESKWLTVVGSLLRERRLELGITLETVAATTKISKSQLAAIEEGDVSRLPAPAYVRGFVRVYASFLGVSPDDLQQETLTEDISSRIADDSTQCVSNGKIKWGKRWFAPVILGISVFVLAYIYQPESRKPPVQQPRIVMPSSAELPKTAVLQPTTSTRNNPLAPSQSLAEKTAIEPLPPTTEGAILKLKVNQDCWLNITMDGAVSQQYDLKAGDLIEWKAKESIALDLGNAGGVEGIFNGKPLESFGEPGKVAHVVLKSESPKDGLVVKP